MREPITLQQRWMCPGCMQTGVVYCSSADDAAKVFELVYQSHKLKSPECNKLIRFGSRTPAEHPNDRQHRRREHDHALDMEHPD